VVVAAAARGGGAGAEDWREGSGVYAIMLAVVGKIQR
jgi:hypothetical protein